MRRLPGLAALLGGALLLTACTPVPGWPGGGTTPPSPTSSAPSDAVAQNGTEADGRTCSGSHLNRNPVLASGQTVLLTADGFGAFVPVELRLMGQSTVPGQRYQADGAGVVRVRYQVSPEIAAGAHLLAFTGSGPHSEPASGSSRSGAGMNVTVTVPNLRLFHFVGAPDAIVKAC